MILRMTFRKCYSDPDQAERLYRKMSDLLLEGEGDDEDDDDDYGYGD